MNYYFEKCIIMGTGKFAFNCAKYLSDNYQLDGVYEYGNFEQSRLGFLCKKNGIPYVNLLNKEQCKELMKKIESNGKKTLIISASNTYLFPQFVTQSNYIRVINYHPALLTKHLGRNAEAWAIYEQNQVAGVTWHEVTEEVDHGDVLAERVIELTEAMTSIQLMIKQYQVGVELFQEFIGQILENKFEQKKKILEYGKMHYSYEKPNNGILDLNWDKKQVSAFLRSMDYSALNIMGKPYIIEENIRYCWESYKILDNLSVQEDTPNNKIILKDKTFFILSNYHSADC